MPITLIDGKAIAARMMEDTAREAEELRRRGRPPCLAAVMIGQDSASAGYARSQARRAEAVGIDYRLVELPVDTDQHAAAAAIERLDNDHAVSGIMLHLPAPKALDVFALQQAIDPAKDVEGVGAANLGLLAAGRGALAPCTAAAAFSCLESSGVEIKGREAVVVGRSVIVGKPVAMLLLAAHATVTQCHTRTRDLVSHTRRADILIAAAGVAGLIGAEHVSPNTVVIDVGTHRVPVSGDGASGVVGGGGADSASEKMKMKAVGDVRFDEVAPIARAITPVPGGVGPVTVATLLSNTVAACRRQRPARG